MEEKDMSRTLQHGAGKTGEIGEVVDDVLKKARTSVRTRFRTAILAAMNAQTIPRTLEGTEESSDVVDEVLGALLEFASCDMVASRIIENESLATDLHERMTRDI